MSWVKIASAVTEIALFIKQSVAKSKRDKYEAERKSNPSGPADRFERDFGAGGLLDNSKLHGDKTDNGSGS